MEEEECPLVLEVESSGLDMSPGPSVSPWLLLLPLSSWMDGSCWMEVEGEEEEDVLDEE